MSGAVLIIIIVTSIIVIAAIVTCIAVSFLADEREMTAKIHLSKIIRHNVEVKHLLKDYDNSDESYARIMDELEQIHKHAVYIKSVLSNKKK